MKLSPTLLPVPQPLHAQRPLLPFAPSRPTPWRTMSPTAARSTEPDPARGERDARLARWIAAAALGDGQAFESFYDATIACARTLARRMLRGAEVDDLLAEAYFEAWRGAARFDPARGSAMTWLLVLVRSRALDALRRRAPAAGAEPEEIGDATLDPAVRLWQQQAGHQLDAALRQLSASERWVLGLAFFKDLSHGQIAQATGLPLGSVKSHLQRAQARLRSALGADI